MGVYDIDDISSFLTCKMDCVTTDPVLQHSPVYPISPFSIECHDCGKKETKSYVQTSSKVVQASAYKNNIGLLLQSNSYPLRIHSHIVNIYVVRIIIFEKQQMARILPALYITL